MLHGQPRYGIVSRFVEEIPPALCKWIVLPERQAPWGRGWGRTPPLGSDRGSQASWSSGGGRAPQADPNRYRSTERSQFETRRPDEHPFAIGQNVRHDKFGDGVVIDFEGRGLDACVQVRFDGFEVHPDLAFVVDRATPVQIAVANLGLERRRGPFVQRIDRLHVVVPIDEGGGQRWIDDALGVNRRMPGRLDEVGALQACIERRLAEVVGIAPNLGSVCRVGRNARDAQRLDELCDEPVLVAGAVLVEVRGARHGRRRVLHH